MRQQPLIVSSHVKNEQAVDFDMRNIEPPHDAIYLSLPIGRFEEFRDLETQYFENIIADHPHKFQEIIDF